MTLIVDWDGTVTVEDTLILALREFGDWEVYLDAAAALKRGEITLHEEIRRDAETITRPIEEVTEWLVANLELRPGLHELAKAHRPTIVSSNFRQLIEPILDREGLELEVRANEVAWHPDGWRATLRRSAPRSSRSRGRWWGPTSTSARSTLGRSRTRYSARWCNDSPACDRRSRPIRTRRSSARSPRSRSRCSPPSRSGTGWSSDSGCVACAPTNSRRASGWLARAR